MFHCKLCHSEVDVLDSVNTADIASAWKVQGVLIAPPEFKKVFLTHCPNCSFSHGSLPGLVMAISMLNYLHLRGITKAANGNIRRRLGALGKTRKFWRWVVEKESS